MNLAMAANGVLTALASAAFLASCAATQAPPAPAELAEGRGYETATLPEATIEIPFTLRNGLILVDGVRVNGTGPYTFMLDTGAQGAGRVDAAVSAALALEQVAEVQAGDTGERTGPMLPVYELQSLGFGGMEFSDVQVLSRSYNAERAVAARGEIGGILGIGLFSERLLTIDYPNRILRIEDSALPGADGEDVLSLAPDAGVPQLTARINGTAYDAYVDSGAAPNITVPDEIAATLPFVSEPAVVGRAATVSGEFDISMGVLEGAVEIGNIRVENPQLIIAEPIGNVVLGAPFLSQFVVTIDQRNHRIRFEQPNARPDDAAANSSARTEPRRRYGVMMSPPSGGENELPVHGVVAGGIAEERGLRSGDVIVAVNGRPVAQLDRSTFGAAMSATPLMLRIERDGEQFDLELEWDE